jgi:beta-phosphoglucomutase-like phosphatase (HAD superfamily)
MTARPPLHDVDLDSISNHWRIALDLAFDGLKAVERGSASLQFSRKELHEHYGRLLRERDDTARLIDSIAHDEHILLRHRLSAPRASRRMLDLPADVLACVFDLDGVLVGSAHVHQAAWMQAFNEFLARWAERTGEPRFAIAGFTPRDYREHIHGKPRLDGVHAFLASRAIRLDGVSPYTVEAIAERKNQIVQRLIAEEGVAAFDGSLRFLEAADEAGLECAVVTASANANAILASAGLAPLLVHRIDGNTMREDKLRAKPAPDAIVAACDELGVRPGAVAGFETDRLGIAAGRAAGLLLTVGVDRGGQGDVLRAAGADRVVADLVELLDPVLV